MASLALIGLGSNLGDRKAILDGAVASLAETPGVEVRAVSSYHETAPVGGPPGQGPFLNAAAAVDSTISAAALHDRLKHIEDAAGRTRVVRWGERTLDLDLLLFGDEVIDIPELKVPHPRMPFRRFVLAPLSRVAPHARDPLTGRSVTELLAAIDRRPSYIAFHRPASEDAPKVVDRVAERLGAERIVCPKLSVARVSELPNRSSYLWRAAARLGSRSAEAAARAGAGWVVSDLWLDGLYLWAVPRLEPGHQTLDRFQERFVSARRMAPEPMMVVRLRRPGPSVPAWADHIGSLDPWSRSASILRLESADDEEAVAEILACCTASRSGSEFG